MIRWKSDPRGGNQTQLNATRCWKTILTSGVDCRGVKSNCGVQYTFWADIKRPWAMRGVLLLIQSNTNFWKPIMAGSNVSLSICACSTCSIKEHQTSFASQSPPSDASFCQNIVLQFLRAQWLRRKWRHLTNTPLHAVDHLPSLGKEFYKSWW